MFSSLYSTKTSYAETMKRISIALLISALCSSVNFAKCSVITMEDRGYKGLMVAIHDSVPEDENLITNLKVLFTKASKFLHDSTNGAAYFKEVTIVVPQNWTKKREYHVLPRSFFGSAHVRVDHANPEYEDTPYTLQTGGCGEPGQYIHLTPRFVGELLGNTTKRFGNPERQLIHEWAHLRYGVFDEYGTPGDQRYPTFYFEKGKVRPTSCVRDILGWIESRNGGPCRILESGQVSSDCVFFPDMNSKEAKASIMYMPYIPSMEGFCDSSSNKKHNTRAPTKHNAMCNYESTWSVIARHQDFQNYRVRRDILDDLEPIFQLIQQQKDQKGRYVLALDVSGSMNGRPMQLLHRAARRLVEDRIPDGAYLGIVQFSTDSDILHGLTKVDNQTRMELSRSLPISDDGGRTAIGKGIQQAIKVLKDGDVPPESGLIILITDGEENVSPFIDDVVPEIMVQKVIINAVAFGAEASEKLENITMMTGGKGYFFANINGSRPAAALDSAFLESVTSQTDVELQPVQLKDEMFDLHTEHMEKQVRIESDLGKNTIFTVTSLDIDQVDVAIMSPGGKYYDNRSPEYSKDKAQKERIQILLPNAEEGKWRIKFYRHTYYPIVASFSVTSEPQDSSHQPIRVRSWLNDMQLKFPAHAKVYAEVRKGYRAVVGATVVATVDRPMGSAVDVTLKDDGVGADVTKNDGVYTGYFTHFNGNGRYAVVANVINDGQAKLKRGTKSSGAPPVPRPKDSFTTKPAKEFSISDLIPESENVTANATANDDDESIGDPAPEFERTFDAGAFRLDRWNPNADDVIPPGDIMDLVVLQSFENYDTNMTEVTLQWTSPGDDLDSGNVSSIELWASDDMDSLIEDARSGFLIPSSEVTNGTLQPEQPGYLQTATVLVPFPKASGTLYFAMIATDEAGNNSTRHSVAAAHINIKKIIKEAAILRQETLSINSPDDDQDPVGVLPDEDKSSNTSNSSKTGDTFKWWIIGLVIGGILGIILLLLALKIVITRNRKKMSYSAVDKDQEL